MPDSKRQFSEPVTVDITIEMIEAGQRELWAWEKAYDFDGVDAVRKIFVAMLDESAKKAANLQRVL